MTDLTERSEGLGGRGGQGVQASLTPLWGGDGGEVTLEWGVGSS